MKDELLLWPPKSILGRSQKTILKSVVSRLIFDSHYNDTLDKIEQDRKKLFAKLHPLDYIQDNCMDFSYFVRGYSVRLPEIHILI